MSGDACIQQAIGAKNQAASKPAKGLAPSATIAIIASLIVGALHAIVCPTHMLLATGMWPGICRVSAMMCMCSAGHPVKASLSLAWSLLQQCWVSAHAKQALAPLLRSHTPPCHLHRPCRCCTAPAATLLGAGLALWGMRRRCMARRHKGSGPLSGPKGQRGKLQRYSSTGQSCGSDDSLSGGTAG